MRRLALCLFLAACGSDPSRYDLVACGSAWDASKATDPDMRCERICEEHAYNSGGGPYCNSTHPPDRMYMCDVSFEDESGAIGCCIPKPLGGGKHVVEFWECAP